jgi:hypothetical protein
MKGNCLILGLLFLFLMGCATATGTFPHGTGTQVDLSKANYRVIKANAIGESTGFNLLGIIPIAPPRYTTAMTDLYSKVGISEGKSHALVNVIQERSNLYLILFSIPKLTIRADIIEFFEESGKK